MSSFDKQIISITDKAKLKEWIDGLHDEAKVVIIAQEPLLDDSSMFTYKFFGGPNNKDCLWMVRRFLRWLDRTADWNE